MRIFEEIGGDWRSFKEDSSYPDWHEVNAFCSLLFNFAEFGLKYRP